MFASSPYIPELSEGFVGFIEIASCRRLSHGWATARRIFVKSADPDDNPPITANFNCSPLHCHYDWNSKNSKHPFIPLKLKIIAELKANPFALFRCIKVVQTWTHLSKKRSDRLNTPQARESTSFLPKRRQISQDFLWLMRFSMQTLSS